MLVTYFNSNKAERALIDKALIFAKEQLLPKVRKLEIDVIMKNNMQSDGFVDVDIDDSRYFTLRIKKSQDTDDLITTIFHEFTHIMQSVKGQDIFAPTDVDYLERDYEIEAFEMQEKLLVDFNSKYATIIV